MKISQSQKTKKHTMSHLSDEDLEIIYQVLPDGSELKRQIRQHLVDCVTEEDLEDAGAASAEDFISNWLD